MSGTKIALILVDVSMSGHTIRTDWIAMAMVGDVNLMDDQDQSYERSRPQSLRDKFFSGDDLCEIGLVGWIVIIVILLALFGTSNSGSTNDSPEGVYEPDICDIDPQSFYC